MRLFSWRKAGLWVCLSRELSTAQTRPVFALAICLGLVKVLSEPSASTPASVPANERRNIACGLEQDRSELSAAKAFDRACKIWSDTLLGPIGINTAVACLDSAIEGDANLQQTAQT